MADALITNNTLERLDLGVSEIAFDFKNWNEDEVIEIQHSQDNGIGVKGANNIAEALKINTTLTLVYFQVRLIICKEKRC